MDKPELLIANLDKAPKAPALVKVKYPINESEVLEEENTEIKFLDDTSLASSWTMLGIIRDMIANGFQAAIIKHPSTKLKFPGGIEE